MRDAESIAYRAKLRRLLIIPIAALLLLAGLLSLGILGLVRSARWVDHTDQVISTTNKLQKLIVDEETGVRGFLLSRDPATLEPWNQAQAPINRAFNELAKLVQDNPGQEQRLKVMLELHAKWKRSSEKQIASELPGAQQTVALLQNKAQMDTLRAEGDKFLATEEDLRQTRTETNARDLHILLLVLGVLAISFSLTVAFWLLHGIATLDRRNQEQVDLAYRERQWLRTTLRAIGDAVIATDAQGRVIFMNEVAEACTGWTEHEAQNLPLSQIFHIVNETTRAKVEDPVAKVQRTGMVCGLANHTILIRKDGLELSIDDSGAPIRDLDGNIGGIVLVFRDVTERNRAEKILHNSEERYRFIAETAEVGYWDWDIVHDVLEWGPVCKRLFGISQDEEMSYRRFLAAVHPEDRERTDQAVRACLVGEGPYDIEYRSIWPDGTVHWIRAKGDARFNNGQAVRMAGVALDISANKKNTEALIASEASLATFVDLIPTLAWMANGDGWIFWYNRRWYEYTGMTEEQMLGWGWRSVHDPAVLPKVMERWTESIKMGRPFEMVFPLRGADGLFRSFITRIIPSKDASGNVIRWFGVNTEVDELQRTKEALAKSQERLQLAQDAGRLALWDWNLATDKFSWTGNVINLYGVPAECIASTEAIRNCLHPDDRERTCEAARMAIENKTEYNGEFRVVWPDDSIHWIGGRGQVVCNSEGHPTALIGTNWDITRIKFAEEALRKTEKLAVAGRLAATIAHEINNPLEAVTNLLYLLRSNLKDEDAREYAVAAEQELARVSLIVNQSLRFHRQSTVPTHERLSAILESAVTVYQSRIAASQIDIRRDYQDQHPVCCFSSELRQVFGNLIGNAFDAIRQDGIIYLRTREARDPLSGELGIRIVVADSGYGMDAQTLHRISEPFFTTKGINGTGLGLWISRDILQKHRAKLRIKSRQRYPSGSVFSVFLPFDAVRPAAIAS